MTKLLHLQGIRGIAIASVIAFHYFPEYCPNGYLGVDLFFVLSGYLMSMMLSRHVELTLPVIVEFLYRRVKRIVPLYYLVIAASIVAVYFSPCTEVLTNIITSRRAIWLVTNIQSNHEQLGPSHGLFHHTWSLCLEMQFYLVFPFLWWMQIRLSPTKRMGFLHIICWASLYFYLKSDENQGFPNMFCRIWQFLFGNMVFYLENYGQESSPDYSPLLSAKEATHQAEEKKTGLGSQDFDEIVLCLEECHEHSETLEDSALLEKGQKASEEEVDLYWIFASLSLILLFYTTVTEQHLPKNYSRIATTVVSVTLIHFGRGFSVLENGAMVFLGEISYAWYLIHWPMVMLQKVLDNPTTLDLFLGMLLSFAAATIVHYLIEKAYLDWSKPIIISVVAILFCTCVGLNYGLDRRLSSCPKTFDLDVSTMSLETKKLYNVLLFSRDQSQLSDNRCIRYSAKISGEAEYEGSCEYENPTSNSNRTISIIGNSWAANVSPLVFEECSKYFGAVHRTIYSSCEVLVAGNQWTCNNWEKRYLKSVEEEKPDYLFIIQRYIFMDLIRSDKEWESVVAEATRRLALLSNHVKEKIFVLHTFPFAYLDNTFLNNYLDYGTSIDWTAAPWKERPTNVAEAQEKLDQIVAKCPKCEQFDYTPQFLVNGTFFPYDPDNIVPYVTQGMHFTQTGLAKVRPIYTDICNRIKN